ncbi:hypothetical protein [Pseudomonas sp. FP1742]|uniref:hypothetical protein n=1 Tax=Pseudomonas sp. FP1742 TaxID=2954079 RepID=UPI002732D75B|nr:hypothetical protein [Pseudomonas sp. FP1742]WLG48894.1 hypothetical protein PSH64_19435 [Pseudomonas sp. FP1742]
MAKPAARITDPTSCPMPGHGPKAIASGSPLQKTYGHSFSIVDSETGQPLAGRSFTATINGEKIIGITDGAGIAHVRTPVKNATISVSIDFTSPARTLSELTD